MDRLNRLDVFYHDRPAGTMALYQNRLAAFEYDSDWLADSLPDGWGRLLVDRLMCFNVFAHNRDDHSKNFTFLYREPAKKTASDIRECVYTMLGGYIKNKTG